MACESCMCSGESKAGEPLLEQTPAAGSQKEQYLAHKSEEQERPEDVSVLCATALHQIAQSRAKQAGGSSCYQPHTYCLRAQPPC